MIHELILPMPPMSKRGHKAGRGRVYKTDKYRKWLTDSVKHLSLAWGLRETLVKAKKLRIEMYGNNAAIDTDNAGGAVMDALVQAKVLKNDNVNNVPRFESGWTRDKNYQRCEIFIEV